MLVPKYGFNIAQGLDFSRLVELKHAQTILCISHPNLAVKTHANESSRICFACPVATRVAPIWEAKLCITWWMELGIRGVWAMWLANTMTVGGAPNLLPKI